MRVPMLACCHATNNTPPQKRPRRAARAVIKKSGVQRAQFTRKTIARRTDLPNPRRPKLPRTVTVAELKAALSFGAATLDERALELVDQG